MGGGASNLPPGFRFFPTDEELVVHFLYPRAALSPNSQYPVNIIPALDLSRYDPWDLNGKALAGGSLQWYYFSRRTQNRMTANGYWKPTGMEEPVMSANRSVGTKKYLVFYVGAAPAGAKTDWMMHEYHLFDCRPCTTAGTDGGGGRRSSKKRGHPKKESDVWVLCRVYESSCVSPAGFYDVDDGAELSCLDEVMVSLDDP